MTIVNIQSFLGYENPPVVEVVCGILFQDLQLLLTPHIGLLWQKFRDEYPDCDELPPLAPAIEFFDESPDVNVFLSEIPPTPRIWFIETNGNKVIQLQRDRLLHNWRKIESEDTYPRYQTVIKTFQNHLSTFEEFLKENDLGIIIPKQYELTYVNHIEQGERWNRIEDIDQIFPNFSWKINLDQLPELEAINWRTSLLLPDQIGRLHLSIRNGIREEDNQNVFVFELNARGIGSDQSQNSMKEWFDLAHQYIIQSFVALTSQDMQDNVWRSMK